MLMFCSPSVWNISLLAKWANFVYVSLIYANTTPLCSLSPQNFVILPISSSIICMSSFFPNYKPFSFSQDKSFTCTLFMPFETFDRIKTKVCSFSFSEQILFIPWNVFCSTRRVIYAFIYSYLGRCYCFL